MRWTPEHRELTQATTYHDCKVMQGIGECNMLAKMGDKLPTDTPPAKPHDVVGQIMPTPAKTGIVQLHKQKHMIGVHWVSWLPMKHNRPTLAPLAMGVGGWWGIGAPWE